jgi:hypothetical protein
MSEYERIIMLSVIFQVNLEKKIFGLITSWEHEHEHHGNMNMNIMGNMGYILIMGPKMKFACEYQIL